MLSPRSSRVVQNSLLSVQLTGDIITCYLGLLLGYLARFDSPLRTYGLEAPGITLRQYQPLLVVGSIFLIASYAYLRLYDGRLLLRPHRSMSIILRATFFWLLAFLGTSLALKFEPAISRVFVATSFVTTLGAMLSWRYLLYYVVSHSRIRDAISQGVVIIGWSDEAAKLAESIYTDANHPYNIVGVIGTKPEHAQAQRAYFGKPLLGTISEIDQCLPASCANIAVVADLDLNRDQLLSVVECCERNYVDFKIIPSFFQIFVSSLRMQTISGVPILGIEALSIATLPNQLMKRAVDIVGGLVGLIASAPIMAVMALIIRKQSPGPIIYRQVRTGLRGRTFTLFKLRSMRLDAEKTGAQWCVADDPRRLPIGAFMRKWNIDELPQFWNVLRGDMSLVGPRPERPELIQKFEREIPHYNPRHEVRPGLTGWAQVNGLRGNTSLVDRIKYDLYYIENWSLWFDFQIMILTFLRRDNAY